jgi:predicted RNA binding protein YcfA (HicA-like mRNA interferase family)
MTASKIPVVKPREAAAVLLRHGFTQVRRRGSHARFRHRDGRAATLPLHGGRDLSPLLLVRVAREAGIGTEEFSRGR